MNFNIILFCYFRAFIIILYVFIFIKVEDNQQRFLEGYSMTAKGFNESVRVICESTIRKKSERVKRVLN